jgi:phosphoribosylformimino-5-aminoimidazole carboxamide ribotide isomerase
MRAVPAVDLRDGACVQLVGGDFAQERVRVADPLAAVDRWRAAGFSALHIVDLDAAMGLPDNAGAIARILAVPGLRYSVGGGVRGSERVEALFAAGATRVVIGTRAVEERAWLALLAQRHPERLVLAADVRGREVVSRGWTRGTGEDVFELLAAVEALPLAAVLVTSVQVEGLMQGPDVGLVSALSRASRLPLIASGGVGSHDDLRRLEDAGASEAIIGMALYTGALDAQQVAKEFPG